MRIDFVIHALLGGGAERVLITIANYLSQKNYRVRIIIFKELNKYELSENIELVGLIKSKVKNKRLNNLYNLLDYYKNKNNRPEALISFITLNNLISIIAAKLYKIPIIVSEHNSYLREQSPKILTKITRNIFYPLADKVTVLTSFDIPFFEKRNCNVMIMPNPSTFKPASIETTRRKKEILAVGNLDRYHAKGLDNLIRIIAPVLMENIEWRLRIIGEGSKGTSYLEKIVKEHNLENQIIFHGFSNDVKKLMSEAEIFILPSRFEGLPMVLLEALSQGMACIAYNCKTGPSDMIEHNINGLLISDQNEEEMVEGLIYLLKSKSVRNKLSNNAIKSLDKFSMETVGNSWEKTLKEIKKS